MTRRTKQILWGTSLLLVVMIIGATRLLYFSDWPGGMRSSYPASDHDPRLAREAQSAVPIIDAIQRFSKDHSTYPAHSSDLVRYLPGMVSQDLANSEFVINGWTFDHTSNGYALWKALGWDPSLQYEFDGTNGSWAFDPGDGRQKKQILLP